MESRAISVNHHLMQRTATLAREVLERAKKTESGLARACGIPKEEFSGWDPPEESSVGTFPQLPQAVLKTLFEDGWNLTSKDNEDLCLNAAFASVAEHMGRISEECKKYYCCVPPFQFKECEVAHVFRYHGREASESLLNAFEDEENKACPIVEEAGCSDTEALIPSKTSELKDISIEVSPGTYTVSVSSGDDQIKQTHMVEIQPGRSVNLSFIV